MQYEISVAAQFLGSYIPPEDREAFQATLQSLLEEKLEGHWHEAYPELGSAYRSINILHKGPDRLLQRVKQLTNISLHTLPMDLCLWIDPGSVSYRQNNYVVDLWNSNFQTRVPNRHSPKAKTVTLRHPAQFSPPHQMINVA